MISFPTMRPKLKNAVKVTLSLDEEVRDLGRSLASARNTSFTALVEELIMDYSRELQDGHGVVSVPYVAKVPGQAAEGAIDVPTRAFPPLYRGRVVAFEAVRDSYFPCSKPFSKGAVLVCAPTDPRPGDQVVLRTKDGFTVAEMDDAGSYRLVFKEAGLGEVLDTWVVLSII